MTALRAIKGPIFLKPEQVGYYVKKMSFKEQGEGNLLKVILNANVLEKKSKLRNLFEKSRELVIVPTYKDNSITLADIAKKFFNNYKISISQETINLLVNRCNGDRGHLKSELDKVLIYIHGRNVRRLSFPFCFIGSCYRIGNLHS